MRLSNFLLWQAAYAEIFVTKTLWPDFRGLHLLEAIRNSRSANAVTAGLNETTTCELSLRMKRVLTAVVLVPLVLLLVFRAPYGCLRWPLAGIIVLALHEYLALLRSARISSRFRG